MAFAVAAQPWTGSDEISDFTSAKGDVLVSAFRCVVANMRL